MRRLLIVAVLGLFCLPFTAAAQDEVLRCEECRRILIRTSESGI